MPIYQCYSPARLLSGPQQRRIAQEITAIHKPESELLVALTEADSANAMEAGLVLPEPGQETGWFAENQARLSELGMTT